MDKVLASPAAAVADIGDGASIGIAGFGVAHRFPSSLIIALCDQGSAGLTVYCNGLGQPGFPTAHLLADSHQISHLVTCFSARPGVVSEAERQIRAGQMTLELVPQGMLVERMRAGGAGLPAFYTPTAVGTSLAAGKDIRYFDGRPYVLERAAGAAVVTDRCTWVCTSIASRALTSTGRLPQRVRLAGQPEGELGDPLAHVGLLARVGQVDLQPAGPPLAGLARRHVPGQTLPGGPV
jgi:3-oxoacid CoA-transferase A subunit